MQRALVVFESMFGNTQTIAEAVADGLSSRFETELVEVGKAPTRCASDVSIVVVGGPTHAFGLSRPATREDAAKQAGGQIVSSAGGIREWLDKIDASGAPVSAAAFDTRIDKPRLPGSAARKAEKRLRRLGFRSAARAQSFFVTGTKGPLVAGEAHRARAWGEQLASATADAASRR
jgi:flavorubredoxin